MSEPTKSPVKDKPLRLLGRSLGAVRRTLFEDRLETPFVLALFACVVLAIVGAFKPMQTSRFTAVW